MEDYHSHNTRILNIAEIKDLLLSLPEVQAELPDSVSAL
jgi:UDP-glucose 4-epimerase